uniref:C-type lectin domain-containing protein n=1 Tax=Salarias fasciatus TaxID=181472 RepID=A0A672F6V5_SALFA
MTWKDAQHYCREKHKDLATFKSMDDIHKLNRPNMDSSLVWIGLHDDPKSWRKMKNTLGRDVNSWRWSATDATNTATYHNWRSYEPNAGDGTENCVMILYDAWLDTNCIHNLTLTKYFCYKLKGCTLDRI